MSWLVFRYRPTSLFSLKTARATSTVGRSLLVPTPYALKMAFLDGGLRAELITDAAAFVRSLSRTSVRIGVPDEACVTGTIQKIRQEPKKPTPEQPYIANVALREVVYFRGALSVAFDQSDMEELLVAIAPTINYLGKRGGFVQYEGVEVRAALDSSFTREIGETGTVPTRCHLSTLDDFGPEATFDALNSFTATPIKRDKHRKWLECVIPLGIKNTGPGFTHYTI